MLKNVISEETIAVYKQVCTTLQKKFSEGLQVINWIKKYLF